GQRGGEPLDARRNAAVERGRRAGALGEIVARKKRAGRPHEKQVERERAQQNPARGALLAEHRRRCHGHGLTPVSGSGSNTAARSTSDAAIATPRRESLPPTSGPSRPKATPNAATPASAAMRRRAGARSNASSALGHDSVKRLQRRPRWRGS